MKQILIINKYGTISEKKINEKKIELDNLNVGKISSKLEGKCISRECDFEFNDDIVSIYAFNEGHHDSINKFDLPPPIDNNIYYNCIIIIAHKNNTIINYTKKIFKQFYESAFGGFEDIDNEDSWSEEEKETSADRDFIVNDDTIEYHNSATESEEEYNFSEEEDTETEEYSLQSSNTSNDSLHSMSLLQEDTNGHIYMKSVQETIQDIEKRVDKQSKEDVSQEQIVNDHSQIMNKE